MGKNNFTILVTVKTGERKAQNHFTFDKWCSLLRNMKLTSEAGKQA